ncbi:MAG: EEP domain-containing protein, partial [Pseudomonas sp.]
MNRTLPAPRRIIDNVTTVHSLNVLAINVHTGFTAVHRRVLLPA